MTLVQVPSTQSDTVVRTCNLSTHCQTQWSMPVISALLQRDRMTPGSQESVSLGLTAVKRFCLKQRGSLTSTCMSLHVLPPHTHTSLHTHARACVHTYTHYAHNSLTRFFFKMDPDLFIYLFLNTRFFDENSEHTCVLNESSQD